MPVAAKRFDFLNEETNVAIADFSKLKDNSILNSVNNELKMMSADVSEFINNAVQDASALKPPSDLDKAIDATKDLVRNTKEIFGSIKDLKILDSKTLDKTISDILPDNPLIKSAFNQISSKCKTGGFSGGGLGKPYNPSINCNGNKKNASGGACNTGQFSDILNKLTGGSYNSAFNDLNKMLKQLISLSKYGFNLNMCGVFGALANGITDKNLLSRASGALLGDLASKSNINGFMDLAAGSVGLHSLLEYPNGLKDTFNNFSKPAEFLENGLSNLAGGVKGAASIFNENWNKASDGLLSIDIFDKKDNTLNDVFKAETLNKYIPNVDNLDFIPDDNDSYFNLAYDVGTYV